MENQVRIEPKLETTSEGIDIKQTLRRLTHTAAIAAGRRSKPASGSVAFAKQIANDGNSGLIDYREVVPAVTTVPRQYPGTQATTDYLKDDPAIQQYPEAFILRLREGRIVAHGVLTKDNRVIGDLSVEAGIRAEKVAGHSLISRPSIPRYQNLDGKSAAIVNAYNGNYYHWLIETIPRYELLKRHAAEDLKACKRIIFNEIHCNYHREVIDYLGIAEKAFNSENNSFICEEMLVPALSGIMINPPAWARQYSREALIGMAATADKVETGPRIYISRANANRRRIVNEQDVLELIENRGFKIIFPENMTVAEQVKTFRDAKVILSQHGAALTNTIFCDPGTKLIELFAPEAYPPCYWLLASHGDLDYRPFICDPSPQHNPELGPCEQDCLISIDGLKKILDSLDVR